MYVLYVIDIINIIYEFKSNIFNKYINEDFKIIQTTLYKHEQIS